MKSVLICMLQLHKNSGSARTAFENIRYFKSKGFEVHVASMTIEKNSIISEGAIPHKMLPFIKSTGVWRRRWYNWQVQRLRKKLNPTLTIGHGDIKEQDVLTLHNCVFLASELIHNRPLPLNHEMAITHGEILKKQHFHKLIANSILMKNDSMNRFNIPEKKIEVIYPSVNTQFFFPRLGQRKELRKRFGFNNKIVVALVTSGNFKKRGLDIFTEAIHKIPEDIRQRADFRVIGKDTGEKNSLITFDPALHDIENYYNAIDIFVLPARIEEFGRVVLEAMASGLPVITTDKVGAAELLEGESRRFIIPSENANALTMALNELINDEKLRIKIGDMNSRSALKEAENMLYKKFDRVFNDLIV